MIDKDEVLLSKKVGLRLVQARKLSDQYRFTQQKAAELLGISAGDLRLMEEGLMLVPLTVIKKAAEVFDVSADWLLGLVADDWELDIETRRERDFLVGLERLHLENHTKVIVKQLEQGQKLEALTDVVTTLTQGIVDLDFAFCRLWELNPQFTDMLGGASFLSRLDQINQSARAATLSLVRAKALPIHALAALPQPRPVLRVWKNPATAQPVVPIAESNPRATSQRNHASLTPSALAS